MSKGKVASSEEKKPSSSSAADLSFVPENDLVELVWENGTVLMQGQSSSRVKKFPPKTRAGRIGTTTTTTTTTNSVMNEVPNSVRTNEIGLSQDDDDDDEIVPWLNYPMDQSLQHDYFSDFLPEISGVTVHEPSFDRRSGGNPSSIRISDSAAHKVSSFEHRIMSNFSEPEDGEAARGRGGGSSNSQLYPFQHDKSRCVDRISDRMSHASIHHAACGGDSVGASTPSLTSSSSGLMNFSHFLRPAALVKANLQNVGSSTTNAERIGSYGKGSVANGSNPSESTMMISNDGLCKEKLSHSQPTPVPLKGDVRGSESRPSYEPLTVEPPPAPGVRQDDVLMNDSSSPCQFAGESSTRGPSDGEKIVDPVVASSSVCSGNSAERVSDDPPHYLKRKHRDNEESEDPSEDAEDESVSVKKATSTRPGASSKRSRAAEVHNLSERRRRDRINEKMRALQELIPNCNKVDKASMLDEAIEYLKTLQLQVQIMSMGNGMYMPQMMLPPGMQHMHAAAAAHMAHFSPMGVGMGMGMGMGMTMGYGMGLPDMNGGASSACPPSMHGAPFAGLYMSGNSAMPGMAGMAGCNLPLYGYPGQGHPMSVPHTPMVPMSGGPLMKSAAGVNPSGTVGPLDNMNPSMASSSKAPMQHQQQQQQHMTQAVEAATNGSLEQPGTAQDNGQAMAGGSTHGNEKVPDRL